VAHNKYTSQTDTQLERVKSFQYSGCRGVTNRRVEEITDRIENVKDKKHYHRPSSMYGAKGDIGRKRAAQDRA
jgi:hypothetical protein